MAKLEHTTTRLVEQRPEVVHDRLLALAARLRDELPPIEPGTQAATMLGMTGRINVEVADRGPNRVELRTTEGRIRALATADLAPTPDGRTNLSMAMVVEPQGFAANMMFDLALKTMPGAKKQVIDGLEASLTDLAKELAKPEGEWDPAAWTPPGAAR